MPRSSPGLGSAPSAFAQDETGAAEGAAGCRLIARRHRGYSVGSNRLCLPDHSEGSVMHTDVAVIGGGPAGLQAALTLGRVPRDAVLFDDGTYRNAAASHMHNVVGSDGTSPADF